MYINVDIENECVTVAGDWTVDDLLSALLELWKVPGSPFADTMIPLFLKEDGSITPRGNWYIAMRDEAVFFNDGMPIHARFKPGYFKLGAVL